MSSSETVWNGIEQAYIPGASWRSKVSPKVRLHSASAPDIDPVTYEVIRHQLWMINHEHGQTLARLSGSPTANIAMDFNPALYNAFGEEIFFGPYIQHLVAGAGSAVKWTMENYGDVPGIADGDVFLENDPWIGCNHQPDVGVIAPIFVDEEIFCWVTNILHQYDLGGSTPGSFCPDATDVFTESTPTPPVKIVERGVLRRDAERQYLRQSRLPSLVALDLRAQIAGIGVAATRIGELVGRYGADVVKATMDKIVEDSERAFLRRIRQIPDGTWTDVGYLEEGFLGDRHAHRMVLSVTKQGETLIFSNDGTEPQIAGSLNCTFIGWKGAIVAGLMPVFCFDQLFAIGGPLRHCRFEPVAGTMTCAGFPAAVSCAPGYAVVGTVAQMHRVMTKMAFAAEEIRPELSPGGLSSWPISALSGVNQWGQSVASILLDEVAGGMGPFPWRDGLSAGGHDWIPLATQANIENNEYFFPILYLYRKLVADSGGAGKWRGGNTFASCYIAHATDRLTIDTITTGQGVPTGAGVFGGAPGSQNRHTLVTDIDIGSEWLDHGRIPADLGVLEGTEHRLAGKSRGNLLRPHVDVYEQAPCAAPGYGDPLERDPQRVVSDVARGEISAHAATSMYGVVITDADGGLDQGATERRREGLRRGRALDAKAWSKPAGETKLTEGERGTAVRVHECLVATADHVACERCGCILCHRTANYKLSALYRDEPIVSAGARMNDPAVYVDDSFVWRRYFCPACLTLMETDVLPREAEPIWDMRLAPAAPADQTAHLGEDELTRG
jgi:N-methylhydantoinase B